MTDTGKLSQHALISIHKSNTKLTNNDLPHIKGSSMPPTPPPSSWVALFPFSGLHIHDEPDMLSTPLFGDATLVSHETVLRAFPNLVKGIGDADAHIAVRRQGIVNTKWFDEDRKNDVFMAAAQKRANEIAALLAVCVLATSTDGNLTGLANRFGHTQEHFALLRPSDGDGIVAMSSGSPIETFSLHETETLFLSKHELRTFLDQPLLQHVTQAISAQKSKLAPALRQSIIQSCLRLASAFYEASYTAQLLGAITSIEILLTGDEQGTSFDVKQRRLGVLLGNAFLEKYEFKKILQARHLYVHQGENETTRSQALMALGVAMYGLFIYAVVAQDIPKKDMLLTYLDAIQLTDKLAAFELNPGFQLTSHYLEQVRLQHTMPFLTYVDDVIAFDKDYHEPAWVHKPAHFEFVAGELNQWYNRKAQL